MYCLIFKFSACPCLSKEKKQLFGYKLVTSQRNNVLGCGYWGHCCTRQFPEMCWGFQHCSHGPQSKSCIFFCMIFLEIPINDLIWPPFWTPQTAAVLGGEWIQVNLATGRDPSARLEHFYNAWQTHPLVNMDQGNPKNQQNRRCWLGCDQHRAKVSPCVPPAHQVSWACSSPAAAGASKLPWSHKFPW